MGCCRPAGNTCFVNAAMQCLRYTPGLPLMVMPDLLDIAAQQQPDSQPPTPTKGRASRTTSLSCAPAALARSSPLSDCDAAEAQRALWDRIRHPTAGTG